MTAQRTFALVGHCGADAWSLSRAVSQAVSQAQVIHADDEAACIQAARDGAVLLINRVLDGGFDTDSGVELIRRLATEAPGAKMVLISNYADAQQAAIAAGARPGFGKSQLGAKAVTELLQSLAGHP